MPQLGGGEFRVGGWWSPRQLHIPVRTGGIFYLPWHRHQIEGTDGVIVSSEIQVGKAGQTELPKFRSEVAAAGFEPS